MPFADVERPAVGVSLLKAEVEAAGADCDVVYLNLRFARVVGLPEYRFVTEAVSWRTLATEWVFARSLYGHVLVDDEAYTGEVLTGQGRLKVGAIRRLLQVREAAERFVERAVSEWPWADYDVIGFTSFSGQNLASLALARRLKEAHPDVVVVFGGRNWEGEMGRELHRRFPFVDFVCSGEADISFLELARTLATREGDVARIGGLVYRIAGRSRSSGPPAAVAHLDELPVPDYRDYFETLEETGYAHQFLPALGMEQSRGCWWAAQRPCAFCGLNGSRTTYRTKSPERFLSEARSLLASWNAYRLELVDMVVPPVFFSRVLPLLAENPLPVKLFLQVRATVTREDLALARRAGVEIQCGVESLSDGVLALANKGTDMLENLRFLKWCAAEGLEPTWPMLYGFPQETSEHYADVLALIPHIGYLPPPAELGSVLVPRFSAYFNDPSGYGLRCLRPLRPYRHLYPFSAASVRRIALFFAADGCDHDVTPQYLEALSEAVREWRAGYGLTGDLRAAATSDGLAVLDRRPGAAVQARVLDSCDEAILRACDDIASKAELEARVDGRVMDASPTLEERLRAFVDQRVLVEKDGRFLSLAVLDEAGLTS